MSQRPNLLFVFGDQWRAHATGYAGDPNAVTPALDAFARQSVHFTNAFSGCPICTPARGTLLTGQYPHTHGLFTNDVPLHPQGPALGECLKAGGYQTAWIGKWHVNAGGRAHYISPDRQMGFDYWKVLECTHDYNNSRYYVGGDPTLRKWEGYDAIAQTRDACGYIADRAGEADPFMLVLSWGPPHDPYQTAPSQYRARFDPQDIKLRPNVFPEHQDQARRDLAGYYAHIAALDDCFAELLATLERTGQADNTIVVFWSDHGDLVGSHGRWGKQVPHAESVRVPLLIRHPAGLGVQGRVTDAVLDTCDLMPTLLGLCDLDIPQTVQGVSFAEHVRRGTPTGDGSALYAAYAPFSNYAIIPRWGGREARGLLTARYTYVRDLAGPWLLYDNHQDPFQLHNRVNDPALAAVQADLDRKLQAKIKTTGDEFVPAPEMLRRWNYQADATGTMPYSE